MPWHKVTLTDEELIAGKGMALQNEFSASFIANGAPKDAAMFCSRSAQESNFYFSPGAFKIAEELIACYAGIECPPPSPSGLSLLVADAKWEEFLLSPWP